MKNEKLQQTGNNKYTDTRKKNKTVSL